MPTPSLAAEPWRKRRSGTSACKCDRAQRCAGGVARNRGRVTISARGHALTVGTLSWDLATRQKREGLETAAPLPLTIRTGIGLAAATPSKGPSQRPQIAREFSAQSFAKLL